MAHGKIHIGTSGWSYKHWKEDFYPPKLKAADWFTYYAGQFDCTEINTSFYYLPKPQTVLNWATKAPPGFVFCPKLSRYITHMKKLRGVQEALQRFFDLFVPLRPFMGPVLVQLPPVLRFNHDVAEGFFALLGELYHDYEFVLEVRHDTWLKPEPLALMKLYKMGLVISQSAGFFPYSEVVTTKNIYVRFHGPEALYASGYSDEMLQEYATKFQQWGEKDHTIWAFFNNDVHGFAYRDARRLAELCGL